MNQLNNHDQNHPHLKNMCMYIVHTTVWIMKHFHMNLWTKLNFLMGRKLHDDNTMINDNSLINSGMALS